MKQARYGFWRLDLLEEMGAMASQRLVDAVAAAKDRARRQGDSGARVLVGLQLLLGSALERNVSRLRGVFGAAPARTDPLEDVSSLLAALRRVDRVWAGRVMALADDGELDAPRELCGQLRPTGELIAEAILEAAELAGRVHALMDA